MNNNKIDFVSRGKLHHYDRPVVMGILNITPDSFYDGGRHESYADMMGHAHWLLDEGADIIDLGAASSRPGAVLPPREVEAARLSEAVTLLRSEFPDVVISVDTCFSQPARAAIEAGADMVNDIGGGDFDPDMFQAVADMQVPYLLMHNRALPDVMQQHTGYPAGMAEELSQYFSQRLDKLYALGVKDVWIDPGFGFAKTVPENYKLLNELNDLCSLFSEPMVAALSRKSMIFKPLDSGPEQALYGTVSLNAVALMKGCRVLRVHDPRPARETITLMQNLYQNAPVPPSAETITQRQVPSFHEYPD